MRDERPSARWAHLGLLLVLTLAACKGSESPQNNRQMQASAPSAASNGPSLNGVLPVEVELIKPANGVIEFRPNFDDFSWRSFIALNWPVSGTPGEPQDPGNAATLTGAGNAYNSVWSTYREAYELYTGATRPQPFDGGPSAPPHCGSAGTKVLLKTTKLGDPLSDQRQALSFPLVDQNNNYIYYEIRFNRDQYDAIRGVDPDPSTWLYRAVNLMKREQGPGVSLPVPSTATPQGAVMVKAAWKQLTAKDDRSRYFTRDVQIYDPNASPACRPATMGLIALHIAHKVTRFPEWIWSSFEHIDNVPPDTGPAPRPMSLNNGTGNPKTVGGWANRPSTQSTTPDRTPTQVTRFNPIPTTPAKTSTGPWPPGSGWPYGAGSTVDINAAYRRLLAGTVWANYQLAITQWPSNPGSFKLKENGGIYPDGAGTPFPVQGAVNAAMETYLQSQRDAVGTGGNSCMQCHYGAGQTDFSWSLLLRAN